MFRDISFVFACVIGINVSIGCHANLGGDLVSRPSCLPLPISSNCWIDFFGGVIARFMSVWRDPSRDWTQIGP